MIFVASFPLISIGPVLFSYLPFGYILLAGLTYIFCKLFFYSTNFGDATLNFDYYIERLYSVILLLGEAYLINDV